MFLSLPFLCIMVAELWLLFSGRELQNWGGGDVTFFVECVLHIHSNGSINLYQSKERVIL